MPGRPRPSARPGRFVFALASAVIAASLGAHAEEASAPQASPWSGSLESGLLRERSQFNVVRIDDAAALLVADGAERRTETFRHVLGNLNGAQPCGGLVTCTANASFDNRTGEVSRDVDTQIAQGDAGAQVKLDFATLGARYLRESWKVGGRRFRRVEGVAADAVVAVNEKLAAYALVNASRYRHPGDSAILDATYQSATGNLRFAPGDAWKSAWTAQVTLSRERNAARDRSLDTRGAMVRLAWDAAPREGWEVKGAFIGQWVRFGDVDPLLGVRRADRFASFDLSVSRRLVGDLVVRLEWTRSFYRSRATAFDNDFDGVGLVLAWTF